MAPRVSPRRTVCWPVPRSDRKARETTAAVAAMVRWARMRILRVLRPPAPGTYRRHTSPTSPDLPVCTTSNTLGGRERRAAGLAAGLGAARGVEALEGGLGRVVDEAHGLGDGPVAGLLRDQPVHLLAHDPVGGVALGGGAQLEEVHRLTGVEVEVEADLVGQRHGVGGLGREAVGEGVVEGGGALHRLVEVGPGAGEVDRFGPGVAVAR